MIKTESSIFTSVTPELREYFQQLASFQQSSPHISICKMMTSTTDSMLSTKEERVREEVGHTSFLHRDSSRLESQPKADMIMMTGFVRIAGQQLFTDSEETQRVQYKALYRQDSNQLKEIIVMLCKELKMLAQMLRNQALTVVTEYTWRQRQRFAWEKTLPEWFTLSQLSQRTSGTQLFCNVGFSLT